MKMLSKANQLKRKGAALLLALFVMTLSSTLAVAMLDAEMIRYITLRNPSQWDEARYLAEAGINEAFAHLENDISWRVGIPATEFPSGSGFTYSVSISDGADGTVDTSSTGLAGELSRTLVVNVKQGG